MSSTEQIKERLSIVDVVGSYIKLEKAGTNYKARCPFHNEKTPSFFVSPQRGSFYCFGCGAKGDIFTFVEQFEGLDFKGALHTLAQKAGVEITYEKEGKKDEKDRLYSILEASCIFFENNLKKSGEATGYIKERGITEESIKSWRLGFSQSEWRGLHDELLKQGFSVQEMQKAGVLKESKGRFYDTFRGRIMFPIFDSAGRVVAFSGRLFEEGGATGKEAPKYVNTPETILFNKSRILYGFDRAKNYIRTFDFSIIVEGQIDIILSHQTPFKNTIAISGTALTNEQLKRLKQLSSNVVLAMDSDTAGINSTAKSAIRAISLGMDVKVANLEEGKDPADVISKDAGNWRNIIRESLHIIDFNLSILEKKEYDERKFYLEISKKILPFISVMPNKIEQSHFISKIASKINSTPEIVREEVEKINPEDFSDFVNLNDEVSGKLNTKKEENVLYTRKELIERRIFGIILWQESLDSPIIDLQKLHERVNNLVGVSGVWKRNREDLSKYEDIIFEVENFYKDSKALSSDVEELLLELEKEELRDRLNKTIKSLKEAEEKGDEEKIEKLRREFYEISKRVKNDG